jgi:ATP-dependent Clp protease ATP-binding subunit ClpA
MLNLSKARDQRTAAMPRFVALMDAARAAATRHDSTAAIFYLSAVCRDGHSLAADLLRRLGVTPATLRALGEPSLVVARLGVDALNGPSLDQLLARAESIAREWHMTRVDSAHALVALFQLARPAMRVLVGAEISAARAERTLGSMETLAYARSA